MSLSLYKLYVNRHKALQRDNTLCVCDEQNDSVPHEEYTALADHISQIQMIGLFRIHY